MIILKIEGGERKLLNSISVIKYLTLNAKSLESFGISSTVLARNIVLLVLAVSYSLCIGNKGVCPDFYFYFVI